MKVLFISNMYPSKEKSYAGIFVKNQYEKLKELMSSEDSIEIFYMKRVFTSKLGSLLKYTLAFLKFIPYYFRKFDVLHVHYFYPLILLAWIYKKFYPNVKVVVTFLGRDINSQVNEKNQNFYRRIAKSIDYSIPVGTTMGKQIEDKLKLKKYQILPCGVNSDIFYFMPNTKKDYDFIMVGSFIHRKGIDTVIEAIKKMPKKSNIRFCFCGSGEYLERLEELQNDYKITIRQNQTQNQIRELLNRSKFFLLMSRAEGFATATTEAFFCGTPVLTSDIPNFKEQVTEGLNGYISTLGDSDELKESFSRLTTKIDEEQYSKLVEGALNSFKNASLHNVCLSIYEIYKMD